MRIALGIEYDGTAYSGWQRQRTGDSVQYRIETALTAVANEAVEVTCAGRTDAGVHASGQVAHFDTSSARSNRGWLLGANSQLPDDINVSWVEPVSDSFHARFSAQARHYRYLVLNRPVRSALYRSRAWWVYQPLDVERMHRAAQTLAGEHDFSAFRAAGCQASSPIREILSIGVARADDWVILEVTANAFLQHMVRNVMGTLVAVGSGDGSENSMAAILDSKDRRTGGPAAPPHGLTLTRVDYPAEFGLPAAKPYAPWLGANGHSTLSGNN
jgi:tRNA pseudouridine38-40 synthase